MKKYSLKKSRGRKYTRRRNIRKYKKNQKGGKTTKRRTLAKRRAGNARRMKGGYEYRFKVNTDKLKKYIENKYGMQLSELQLVAYGNVAITNRSKGFFLRADHRQEEISVFACYENNSGQPAFYAIARCVNSCPENLDPSYSERKPIEAPNFDMEEKILFLYPTNLTNININADDPKVKKAIQLFKDKMRDHFIMTDDEINNLMKNITMVEFKNNTSSEDTYRMVIFPNSQKLGDFFQNVIKNPDFKPSQDEYPKQTIQPPSQKPKEDLSTGLVAAGFAATLLALMPK